MSTLRALIQLPGNTTSRNYLLRLMPKQKNEPHTVDTAMLYCQKVLVDKNIVKIVVDFIIDSRAIP